MADKRQLQHYRGCLLGGAVGDALGAPIEFDDIERIRSDFGPDGVSDFVEAYGRTGAITDDTQMTLFTAEGLILSKVRQEYQGDEGIASAGYHALLRWLSTQDTPRRDGLISTHGTCSIVDGILTGNQALYSLRAPGNSCLSALRSGRAGTPGSPVNDSKGCGGVMRMAPVGLAYADAEKAFHIGCRLAALTHGHPAGYLSAGTFAALISAIITGGTLAESIEESRRILRTASHYDETLKAIDTAADSAAARPPGPGTVASLGEGWIAEEALAIGIYSSLVKENDFSSALLLAVNHSGDSDSTGSITGNILGALHGEGIIPEPWIAGLELRELIEEMATDLFDQFKTQ